MEITLIGSGRSSIQSKIYEIRGQRVMLDFDLAEMYQVQTKVLKQTIKRNIKRFPKDFMFELTKNEWNELVTNCDHIPANMKYSYILPLAFTEHGVTMLSSVLRSDIAINVNIQIVRAFVAMRQRLANPPEERHSVSQKDFDKLRFYRKLLKFSKFLKFLERFKFTVF